MSQDLLTAIACALSVRAHPADFGVLAAWNTSLRFELEQQLRRASDEAGEWAEVSCSVEDAALIQEEAERFNFVVEAVVLS